MGGLLSKVFGKKKIRILMLGLDAAGKTTVLQKLCYPRQSVRTIPTVGFNVETMKLKNVRFNVWDLGGQWKLRPLWRHYFTGTEALVFVVDCADIDRIEEAKEELHRLVNDKELCGALLLVLANKQDIDGAIPAAEIPKKLGLDHVKDREWYVQPTCAASGEGLEEGLTWLADKHFR